MTRAPDPTAASVRGADTEDPGVPPPALGRIAPSEELRRMAAEAGLGQMGIRPKLRAYLRSLWERRHFTTVLARAKAYARNQNSYLGQLWAVLTPTLNAIVYVLVFGVLIGTNRGMDNVVGFIVVGTFTFRFFEQSVMAGAKSIKNNLHLVRSVHFPRAVLPISSVVTELATLVPALVVMCTISFLSGFLPGEGDVPIRWSWFLLIPAVALMWLFNTGCAFVVARWVAIAPDLENFLPFALRFVMYGSGVIFSIQHYVSPDSPFAPLLTYQPVAVYLYLVRASVLNESSIPQDPFQWLLGVVWAVVFLVAGFLVFWRGEERYGRD